MYSVGAAAKRWAHILLYMGRTCKGLINRFTEKTKFSMKTHSK
jgi:hypothetical protein